MENLSSKVYIPEVFQGGRGDITAHVGFIWRQAKAPLLVPLLKLMVIFCLTMSIMLFVERVCMGFVIVLIKIFRWKPEKKYKWEPMKEDLEMGNSAYPMVLVQIPMYNEKEVVPFLVKLLQVVIAVSCIMQTRLNMID